MMFRVGCNDFSRRFQGGSKEVLLCLAVTARQVRKVRVDSEGFHKGSTLPRCDRQTGPKSPC